MTDFRYYHWSNGKAFMCFKLANDIMLCLKKITLASL